MTKQKQGGKKTGGVEDPHVPSAFTAPVRVKKEATVTCKHCRYEYDADIERCSICGYPWPWLGKHPA